MNDLRIVYAFGYVDECAMVVDFLRSKMVAELTAIGKTVSRIEIVPTKLAVEELLDTGDFNLLIVREELQDERISSGSLKSWSQKYPNLPVILYVRNEKKGGEKLKRLLNTAPFYYNVLYENDLTGSNVMKLIKTSRTREEAICYYGLEQRMEKEDECLAAEAEKTDVVEETVGATENPVIPAEEDSLLEDLEETICEFDVLESDVIDANESDSRGVAETNTVEVKPEEPGISFDYEGMFSGNELFGEKNAEVEEMIEEEPLLKEVEIVVAEDPAENHKSELDDNGIKMKEQEYLDVIENTCTLPENGKILRVLDRNTMLMELSQPPIFEAGKTLEDYKLLFVVKGTKGSFVNGKYKVGVKSFEGYAGSLLGRQTIIVEIPEYDLVENKVEGADCSIICIAQ